MFLNYTPNENPISMKRVRSEKALSKIRVRPATTAIGELVSSRRSEMSFSPVTGTIITEPIKHNSEAITLTLPTRFSGWAIPAEAPIKTNIKIKLGKALSTGISIPSQRIAMVSAKSITKLAQNNFFKVLKLSS